MAKEAITPPLTIIILMIFGFISIFSFSFSDVPEINAIVKIGLFVFVGLFVPVFFKVIDNKIEDIVG